MRRRSGHKGIMRSMFGVRCLMFDVSLRFVKSLQGIFYGYSLLEALYLRHLTIILM